MQKYTAILTRDIVETITMQEVRIDGVELEGGSYTIDCPMKAGKRGFKTIKRMKAWIDAINAEHGLNTAIIG